MSTPSEPGLVPAEDRPVVAGPADEDDLRASLLELSRLSTVRLDLTDLLVQVATFAVRAIPGADGAGLTLLEHDRSDTMVASAPFVREIDAIQYGLGEGPCISAAAERATIRSGSLGGERRWPRFGPRAGRLGVHSVVSLPLLTPDGVVGAMNVYAHGRDAFDTRAAQIGELFAVPAAIAVQNAHVLAEAKRLAASLQAALTAQSVIDRAVGVLMSRSGYTPEQAYDRLRQWSQTTEHQAGGGRAVVGGGGGAPGPGPAYRRLRIDAPGTGAASPGRGSVGRTG